MKNRLRAHRTWPDDLEQRRELARLDVDFVNAIHACGVHLPLTLLGLRVCAHQAILEVQEILGDDAWYPGD